MKKLFTSILIELLLVGCSPTVSKPTHNLYQCDLIVALQGNQRWVYLDKTGKTIIDGDFTYAENFYNDIAIVEGSVGAKYLIDKEGQAVIDKKYPILRRNLENHTIYFANVDTGGLMDESGNIIATFHYSECKEFSEGLAEVSDSFNWGFIDATGELVIPIEYEETSRFFNGLAAVKKNGLWGYINSKNEVVIDFQYNQAWAFDQYDHAIVQNVSSDPSWSLIDREGNEILSNYSQILGRGPLYIGIEKLNNKAYLFKEDGSKFIDDSYLYFLPWADYGFQVGVNSITNHNILFQEDGTVIQSADIINSEWVDDSGEKVLAVYNEGYADVYLKEKTLHLKADEFYDMIDENQFIVKRDGYYCIIDDAGNELTECKYQYLSAYDDNILFKLNYKYGVMNYAYEIVIDALYKDIIQ